MDIKTVGVVGCGLMGSGIAEVFARAGATVVVHEVDAEAARRGRARVEASVRRAAATGKIGEAAAATALERVTVGHDLDALATVDLVVEAANEDERVKIELFRRIDRVLEREDTILASNTSSVPIMKLGTATGRPAYVVGLHFFNPVPVLPLVEVVPSLLTSPHTEQRARIPSLGTFDGSTRKTDRHSGHETFTYRPPLPWRSRGVMSPSPARASARRCVDRSSRPSRAASSHSSSFPSPARSPAPRG